jgi:hypothetical protein
MLLRATSVSRALLDSLPSQPRRGRVHSVYDRTVNILCDDSLWVSLHPGGVPRHPYSVTVEEWEGGGPVGGGAAAEGGASDGGGRALRGRLGGFLGAFAGDPAYAGRSWIRIGDAHAISLLGASVWEGRFVERRSLGDQEIRLAADLVEAAGVDLDRSRGVRSPFLVGVLARVGGKHHARVESRTELDRCLFEAVDRILDDFRLARCVGSRKLLLAVVKRAAGLGFGLTPSGDDFLTGLIAGSCICPDPRDFRCGLVAAVESAADSTTLPSGFMLRAALQGYFSEPLVNLLSALLAEADGAAARGWAKAVAGLGATSGEDMLAGVLFGLRVSEMCEECHEASAR